MIMTLTKEEAIAKYGKMRGNYYLVEVYLTYAGICVSSGSEPAWIWGVYKGKQSAYMGYKAQCDAAKNSAKDGIFKEGTHGVAFETFKHTVPVDHIFKFTDAWNDLLCTFRIHVTKI